MISNKIRLISVIAVLGMLTGCVLAPGSNMDPDDYDANTPSGRTLRQSVDIVPINASVIASYNPDSDVAASMPASLQNAIENYQYFVEKGDILSVTVYDHPELTNPAGSFNRSAEDAGIIVESDGTIYYPYIGKVSVAGRTVDQIRRAISGPLAEFIMDPQVSVKVLTYNAKRYYITGEVQIPGPQPITNVPMTVLDAISKAGGMTENANWHEVILSRNGEDVSLSVYEMLNNGRLGQNMLMQHGDVLHVPNLGRQQVFVLGEARSVNALPMGNIRMSLTEALTRAGGLNQVTSDAEGVFVIRQTPADTDTLATVYQLDVSNAVALALGARFMLEPSDIVYVTTAPITRWNRVINQILPSLNALVAADRTGGN